MFDGLALILEIISDTEIKVYTLDSKENIILNVRKEYTESIKDMIENDETIIVPYDIESKTIDEKEILDDMEIEEFRQ